VIAAIVLVLAGLTPGHQQGPASAGQTSDVIAEVRVHGNHISTNDEVLALSGIAVGAPFTPTTLAEVRKRLEDSGKFDEVEVLKRFASIADPSRIALVLIVNEGPVRLARPDGPDGELRPVRRSWLRNLMFMPVLDAEDGYGFTYGVRLAYVNWAGERSRLSFPLTWGGTKRAGAEFDRTWAGGPLSRIQFGSAVERTRNPAFDELDDRRRVWARAERHLVNARVRAGGTVGWQDVSFGSADDNLRTAGADLTLDTRIDPLMPRNAVYARASLERVWFTSGASAINRTRLEGHGYLGLVGQTVLVVRAAREDSSRAQPDYLRPLLGGWSSLRGFKAGSFVGDTLVNGSVELRIPLSSPLSIGRLGVSAFVDTGTVYANDERFDRRKLRTGIGGSAWITLASFQISLGVAHGRGADTRVHFGGGFVF
jgi:outer membrane protein assembly factor BamA